VCALFRRDTHDSCSSVCSGLIPNALLLRSLTHFLMPAWAGWHRTGFPVSACTICSLIDRLGAETPMGCATRGLSSGHGEKRTLHACPSPEHVDGSSSAFWTRNIPGKGLRRRVGRIWERRGRSSLLGSLVSPSREPCRHGSAHLALPLTWILPCVDLRTASAHPIFLCGVRSGSARVSPDRTGFPCGASPSPSCRDGAPFAHTIPVVHWVLWSLRHYAGVTLVR